VANTLIHENRRLQFPLDTLVDALIELENKQGHWPPKATVVGASIDNSGDDNAGVILSIHRPESGEVIERRYSLPMLAAAIVNYCLTVRVPIPRNSTKSIQVLADGVALVLENTVMLQSRHEELSTLVAGSVRTMATAPAASISPADEAAPAGETPPAAETAPPGEAPPPGAPPNGAAPANEATVPSETVPSETAPPDEAAKTSSQPSGDAAAQ
jgi:hypothetical protein